MDRLILLRHAKADQDSPTGDVGRRLSPRGLREAAAMGRNLADLGLIPDLVLVSTAERTRETWTQVRDSFPKAEVRFHASLYQADDRDIRQVLQEVDSEGRTVMVIGHNPALQDLTVGLLTEGGAEPGLIARAQARFPTATAAVFLIDAAKRASFDGLFYPRHDE